MLRSLVQRSSLSQGIDWNLWHSMDANKQHSPLLSLTPEIRNRIYEFTLGGADIHISCRYSTLNHSLCTVGLSGRSVPQERSRKKQRLARLGWAEQHAVFIRNRHAHPPPRGTKVTHYGPKLDFSLLRTCEQIHQETALLSFALNTFISPTSKT